MPKWEFHRAKEAFEKYRGEWDALNRICGNHMLLDSQFVLPLVSAFANEEILLGISNDTRYPGMALLERIRKGIWQTFQPSQAPMGLIVFGNKENLNIQMQNLILSLPDFVLGLSITQQDPMCTMFKEIFNDNAKGNVEFLDYIDTARITLSGSFEEYWMLRGKNLRSNIPKLKRKLKDAELVLRVVWEAEQIDECMQAYCAMETSGWKLSEGTAISYENAQGVFYRDMLKRFCVEGEGVVYQLTLDGIPLASDLCIKRNGVLIVLKTAYHQKFQNLSPSFLMREEILRRLFDERKVGTIEFYGRAMEWHRKWTNEIRTMYHVNVYRNALIRKGRNVLKRVKHVIGV